MISINFRDIICFFGFHLFVIKISPYEKDYQKKPLSIDYEISPTVKTCLHCQLKKTKVYHCFGTRPLKHNIRWVKI